MKLITKSKVIKKCSLHSDCWPIFRLDIVPFFILYAFCLYVHYSPTPSYEIFSQITTLHHFIFPPNKPEESEFDIYDGESFEHIGDDKIKEHILLMIPVILIFQSLAFLSTFWSVHMKSILQLSSVNSVENAKYIKVVVHPTKGSSELCTLEKNESEISFSFQKRKYNWNPHTNKFEKRIFPIKLSFGEYIKHQKGLTNSFYQKEKAKFGLNKFDIPIPTFGELYQEQATAPFFVFQVFCVLLWLLDEYWYYSLFTLFMLLVFEATVVQSRLKNLKSLRNMVQPVSDVLVHREGKWSFASSDSLVPGDICAIGRNSTFGPDGSSDDGTLCPCDLLLISGSCVMNEAMLTGESVPQMKEGIRFRNKQDNLDLKRDKIHILFGGTRVVQHSPDEEASFSAPENMCLCYVLKTGFDTSQGKLMRTILFSTQRVTANTMESLLFIGFLLIFALIASGYVLKKGLETESRSKYKLLLDCTLIITSVVPPELPMELSLAVNTSLIALAKLGVFCTEPFRIPFAGKVDVCCFDKTGTLTKDDIILNGLAGIKPLPGLIEPTKIPDSANLVIAGCHALMYVEGKLVGDPIETAAMRATGCAFTKGNISYRKDRNHRVKIIHRYHFNSALKRMSTIVSLEHDKGTLMGMTKGAPEVIEPLLKEVPKNYTETYKYFSQNGGRVIALAFKPLQGISHKTANQLKSITRETIESELRFAGFLVFTCPMKPDTENGIHLLRDSSHRVVMITGDNILTACQVASDLKITEKPSLISVVNSEGICEWTTLDESQRFQINGDTMGELQKKYDFCLSGEVLSKIVSSVSDSSSPSSSSLWSSIFSSSSDGVKYFKNRKQCYDLVRAVNVFARTTPEQKEWVLSLMKQNYTTLMCGDGTNDVGALKQAHVGIALLNRDVKKPTKEGVTAGPQINTVVAEKLAGKNVKSIDRSDIASRIRQRKPKKNEPLNFATALKQLKEAWGISTTPSTPTPTSSGTGAPGLSTGSEENAIVEAPTLDELAAKFDTDQVPLVQLGDASIASSFTTKSSSIIPVLHIIRQGRCTLVTTLQMYKILAINCLVSAYTLSVLYLDGVKLGDTQATLTGMLIATCFLFISRSRPLEKVSNKRPVSKVFCPYMIISILGQFAIHLTFIIYIVTLCQANSPKKVVDLEADFEPSLLNTGVFLISCCMQISTFAINYRGHPFMEGLTDNQSLLWSLVAASSVTFVGALQISETFNYYFELYPFPSFEFQMTMMGCMIGDIFIAWIWEQICHFLLLKSNEA